MLLGVLLLFFEEIDDRDREESHDTGQDIERLHHRVFLSWCGFGSVFALVIALLLDSNNKRDDEEDRNAADHVEYIVHCCLLLLAHRWGQ